MGGSVRAIRRSTFGGTEPCYKYLKPGALARLRDSRISARSPLMNSHSHTHVHRDSSRHASPPSDGSSAYVNVVESFPFLVPRANGPRFPQRKKLLATKSLWAHSPSPGILSPASPSDSVDDVSVASLEGRDVDQPEQQGIIGGGERRWFFLRRMLAEKKTRLRRWKGGMLTCRSNNASLEESSSLVSPLSHAQPRRKRWVVH